MFKTPDFNKIKTFLKKFPETLAEKSFLTFLILSLLAFFISGLIFYKYYYLIEKTTPKVTEKALKIEMESYQDLLNFWDLRFKKFEGADFKEYKNPFQVLTQ
jgi:hypothetical protein